MAGHSDSRQSRNTLFPRAGWVLLTLAFLTAIVLDALFSETGIIQLWSVEEDYVKLHQEVRKLEKENAELEQQIEALSSGTEGTEKIAREELGFVKPGEHLYIFPKKQEKEQN